MNKPAFSVFALLLIATKAGYEVTFYRTVDQCKVELWCPGAPYRVFKGSSFQEAIKQALASDVVSSIQEQDTPLS